MGAFIQLKEPPRNKRILLDIGIAGPIAGLMVAIPILLYGLSLSTVSRSRSQPGQGFTLEGNSLLYLLAKFVVFGQLLPAPANLWWAAALDLLGALLFHQPAAAPGRSGCDDPPCRLGWMGGTAGDCLEPDPRRAAGWRSHDVRFAWETHPAALAVHPGRYWLLWVLSGPAGGFGQRLIFFPW